MIQKPTRSEPATLAELVDSYREYLRVFDANHSGHEALKRLDQRLASQPQAAHGEAITFEFLRHRGLSPSVYEHPTTGGVDFECTSRFGTFGVEVTAFSDEIVRERSGVSEPLANAGSVSISRLMSLIRSRLSSKSSSSQTYDGPSVLVLVAEHAAAKMFVAAGGIVQFLTGEPKIFVPINSETLELGQGYVATQLENSAYLQRSADSDIVLFRRKYALVLFIVVETSLCSVTGMVHPEPEHSIPYSVFSGVPFARMRWPIVDDVIEIEWVVSNPQPERHPYCKIAVSEEEIKRGIS